MRFRLSTLLVLLAFALLMFSLAIFAGCAETGLTPILANLKDEGQDTQTIVSDVASCYTGLRVEDDAYQAIFDRNCIDAVLVGTPIAAKTPPVAADGTQTFANIIADVEKNGVKSAYKGKTVTVTGSVSWKFSEGTALTISEDGNLRDGVVFFIFSFDDRSKLAQYRVKKRYTFTVYIDDIKKSSKDEDTHIISEISE